MSYCILNIHFPPKFHKCSLFFSLGNAVVRSESELPAAIQKLGGKEIYAEKWANFTKELAVMVVQTQCGITQCYPVVETIQKDNICHIVIAPAQISQNSINEALKVAKHAIVSLPGAGIYGVELFLLPDDSILLNEIAPRFVRTHIHTNVYAYIRTCVHIYNSFFSCRLTYHIRIHLFTKKTPPKITEIRIPHYRTKYK